MAKGEVIKRQLKVELQVMSKSVKYWVKVDRNCNPPKELNQSDISQLHPILRTYICTYKEKCVLHFAPPKTSVYPPMTSQGQASGMDGTLTLIFAISKTIRDSKKLIK